MKTTLRTGIALTLAVATISLAAFLYATGRATALQALNWPFFVWIAIDVWYARKWAQFRKVGGMTLGQIHQAHVDGTMKPSSLWLSRTLDTGTWLLLVAMVVTWFRN